jgi:hypothetical protein
MKALFIKYMSLKYYGKKCRQVSTSMAVNRSWLNYDWPTTFCLSNHCPLWLFENTLISSCFLILFLYLYDYLDKKNRHKGILGRLVKDSRYLLQQKPPQILVND